MNTAKKQDLPPPVAYKRIPIARVPPKTYVTGWQMIGNYAAVTTLAKNVIFPMLIAERDREFLKQLRRNRDEEAKSVAKVPGYEVSTWKPLKPLPKDNLIEPGFDEFYVHSDWKPVVRRAHIKLWS